MCNEKTFVSLILLIEENFTKNKLPKERKAFPHWPWKCIYTKLKFWFIVCASAYYLCFCYWERFTFFVAIWFTPKNWTEQLLTCWFKTKWKFCRIIGPNRIILIHSNFSNNSKSLITLKTVVATQKRLSLQKRKNNCHHVIVKMAYVWYNELIYLITLFCFIEFSSFCFIQPISSMITSFIIIFCAQNFRAIFSSNFNCSWSIFRMRCQKWRI